MGIPIDAGTSGKVGLTIRRRKTLEPAMRRAIQLHNHPFRFLLYLEWGLLVMAIVTVLDSPMGRQVRRPARGALRREGPPPELFNHGPHQELFHQGLLHPSPLLAVFSLVSFGLMGLYLPAKKWPKLGHTLGQILLIALFSMTALNDGRTFPFVYLVLVIRGCLMFGLTGRLVLTGTAFMLFLVGLLLRVQMLFGLGRRLPPEARDRLQSLIMGLQLNFIVLFGLSLLLLVLLINALLTERQSQQQLRQVNQELRESAQAIEKLAMDQERNRIARDIHDALGHSLTALNIQLESAVKLWDKEPNRARQFLGTAKQLGTQSLQEVRQSVAELRQDPLAGQTLEGAIANLIQTIQSNPENQLKITPTIALAAPLPTNLKVLLYRVIQEGLTNIVKHAGAHHARLQLTSSAQIVSLSIEDDGQGFEVGQARTGFGLQSMRDRAESVGGTFTLHSSARGTQLQLSLPVSTRP